MQQLSFGSIPLTSTGEGGVLPGACVLTMGFVNQHVECKMVKDVEIPLIVRGPKLEAWAEAAGSLQSSPFL
jgi:hypothetical protein